MDTDLEVRFSEHFRVNASQLDASGTFDPILTIDTPLAIDPKLLDFAKEPELDGAHEEVLEHFGKVFKLLRLSQKIGDKAWRAARMLLEFHEFKGASLGTSKSGNGSGWGKKISEQILFSAKEIVTAGLDDPAFFELLALFEHGIGADRLGDMLGTILFPRLASYTNRICKNLSIDMEEVLFSGNKYDLPTWLDSEGEMRYVILVPNSILSDLPVGLDRSQIEFVASRNAEARAFLNREIGADWRQRVVKSSSPQSKSATKSAFFSNIPYFRQFIEHYRKKQPTGYNFESDPKAINLIRDVLTWAYENAAPLTLSEKPTREEVYAVVRDIVLHFKQQVEQNRLSKAFFIEGKPRREEIIQGVFQAVADAHCKHNGLDLSAEVNAGRGPVDFKFSNGRSARVLVELKLSQSTQLIHGFEKQLAIYEAAEQTNLAIYLVIYTGFGDSAMERLYDCEAEAKAVGKHIPEIIVIDATPKLSGSRA